MTNDMFTADLFFIGSPERGEIRHQIYFRVDPARADSHDHHLELAMADAVRWARNRQRVWDDWGILACVKVYDFDPAPIAENGQYDLPHRGFGKEWKYDCGLPAPGEE